MMLGHTIQIKKTCALYLLAKMRFDFYTFFYSSLCILLNTHCFFENFISFKFNISEKLRRYIKKSLNIFWFSLVIEKFLMQLSANMHLFFQTNYTLFEYIAKGESYFFLLKKHLSTNGDAQSKWPLARAQVVRAFFVP